MHSFQTEAFSKGLFLLADLPDDCTPEELKSRLGSEADNAFVLLTTWESLGSSFLAANFLSIWWMISSAALLPSRGASYRIVS